MQTFLFDNTFDGLLSAVFDAYTQKRFPDCLLPLDAQRPLHAFVVHTVVTEQHKAARVAAGLEGRLSPQDMDDVRYAWLAEETDRASFLFRVLRKVFDNEHFIAKNMADEDMLRLKKVSHQVTREGHCMTGFVRFQKTGDGRYFAPISPAYNVLPLLLPHFADRFADQEWIIYDTTRRYGVYFDTKRFHSAEIDSNLLQNGSLPPELLAPDEQLFQSAWKDYCKALCIKERINPVLQRRLMPKRLWKYLTERQDTLK